MNQSSVIATPSRKRWAFDIAYILAGPAPKLRTWGLDIIVQGSQEDRCYFFFGFINPLDLTHRSFHVKSDGPKRLWSDVHKADQPIKKRPISFAYATYSCHGYDIKEPDMIKVRLKLPDLVTWNQKSNKGKGRINKASSYVSWTKEERRRVYYCLLFFFLLSLLLK